MGIDAMQDGQNSNLKTPVCRVDDSACIPAGFLQAVVGVAGYECSWLDGEFEDHLFELHGIVTPPDVKRSVRKRRCEYFYGRLCARAAIRGITPDFKGEVLSNPDRSPRWPNGIIGSISHCDGSAICVCSRSETVLGIGIDIERILDAKTAGEVAGSAVMATELDALGFSGWTFEEKVTFAFSAKESLYKALYPSVKKYFGFDSAAITKVDAKEKSFVICLTTTLCERWREGVSMTGQYQFRVDADDHAFQVLTAIIVPHDTGVGKK